MYLLKEITTTISKMDTVEGMITIVTMTEKLTDMAVVMVVRKGTTTMDIGWEMITTMNMVMMMATMMNMMEKIATK